MRFAERAPEDRKILAEDKDKSPVHGPMAGDDAIARDLQLVDTEIMAAMLDEHVPFLEGTGVEQQLEALPRSQLSTAMLGFGAALSAARARRRPLCLEPRKNFLHLASLPEQCGIASETRGRHSRGRPACPLSIWQGTILGISVTSETRTIRWRKASCIKKAQPYADS